MQRIDGPTRSAVLPAPGPVGTGVRSPGYFQNGNPLTGTPPTTLDVDWANNIQEEVASVIEAAGIALDKANHAQLLAAISIHIEDGIAAANNDPAPTSSLGATGYRIAADGYIEQWGYDTTALTTEHQAAVNFPIPFPNECFGISGTVRNTGGGFQGCFVVQEVSVSKTGAVVFLNSDDPTSGGGAGGFRWFARGH